ncbi:bifunctional diguanylate cyclase/phosphodiesterase [Sphingomonas sp. LB-2]|uniref:putative bifunctional diguanylate cyclase/phosphodiesterase n=1 Tax=Sphingomonas caeni TaxID=2984949 RepID=UPI00222FC16E|nr:bifunctional diguanylate cyclase/phosphodiesterase [Sphingomonas caeni]MCW3847616.1 bifunctional diguanylate cyclase/phosphodiesterase [Sphingomonas caeni]
MDEEIAEAGTAGPTEAPMFVLSFRQRDEMATAAAGAGWRVVAARRAEGVERRFLASGASVAVIDARGALSDGIEAARALGGVIEANGGAMLVLVSQSDTLHMRAFYDAGATHFLSSPMSSPAIAHAMRFAQRHVERMAGGFGGASEAGDLMGWRYDADLKSLQLTPAFAALLGLPEGASVRSVLALVDPADRKLGRAAIRRLSEEKPSTAFAHDLPGAGRIVQHLQRDPRTGRLHALVERLGSAPDAGAAVRDVLTGARDGASARRWIERRLGDGATVSAILIGLTRFETVNTAYGRPAGDALLRAVSRRLSEVAREALGRRAVVARMGGSEFLVATDDADAEKIALASARFEEAIGRPFVIEGEFVPLGARVVSAVSAAGDSAAGLLRRASEALFEHHVPREASAPSMDALAADLRHALDRGEIGVLFQPQVSIANDLIVGVEALARWQHPELGEIGAETLFAAAEHAGLAGTLSDHVQALALRAAAAWPAGLSKLRLSINVTAGDVGRPGFADSLLGRIDASGFPRGRLTIELTESGIMQDLGEAARLFAELRTAGCRVAIDDFGTGYSSLAYLKALPLDYLKIDKKLSQDITGSARDRVVVRGVIDMARSLGLSVVAEGVETKAQLDLLAKEGCNYYQGFLRSGPIDGEALARLMGG